MTIYRIRDCNGHILRYQARIERKSVGKMRQSFSTLKEAVAWVKGLNKSMPCQSPAWANRKVTVKDLKIKGNDARGKAIIKIPPQMERHGCTLIRGPGRCEPLDRCEHYLGCLDAADKSGWEGWSCLNQ